MRKIDLRLLGGLAFAVAAASGVVAFLWVRRRAEEEADIYEAYAPQRPRLRLPAPPRRDRYAGQSVH